MQQAKVTKVRKRDGRVVKFDPEKITEALKKAIESVGGADFSQIEHLVELVIQEVTEKFKAETPGVEDVQDAIEKVLIEQGHAKTAKSFILYRAQRQKLREAKASLIGVIDDSILTVNALKIAEAKYLQKDDEGNIETPNKMFKRVARTAAKAEEDKAKAAQLEEEFFEIMSKLEFLPGGRILANAGTKKKQLANCYVLPVKDSMEGIFTTLLNAAQVQKAGAGTGFSFSKLRPKGSVTSKSYGQAVGPVPFIHIFNAMSDLVYHRGKRKGANMGVLRVDHPDILAFISAKEDMVSLQRFNLSVGITDKFMTAVKKDNKYDLVDPHTGEIVERIDARKVFDILVTTIWKYGEPGVLFLDKINRKNPLPSEGEIEATSACGEIPLLPYESCCLGSVNLEKFVKNKSIDFDRLGVVVKHAVHFLDNVIDVADYPLEETQELVKRHRKIGLGVMGFADLLFALQIPYDSEEGIKIAEKVMGFIRDTAREASNALAERKGAFSLFKKSVYAEQDQPKLRNASITAIAPTGTISMLAETSSSIEPNFAICYMKHVLDGNDLVFVNKHFENLIKEKGLYTSALIKQIIDSGSVQSVELPNDIKKVFKISHEITPEWHVRMQAAFQKYVDGCISKTVNFPYRATMKDVETVLFTAYDLGCKGITIYRDGSRQDQILRVRKG